MSEKVLLVDDEVEFLEIMSERMEARGMAVTTCTSAEEAVEIIKTETFDAIILDFMMPGMDGFQALKEIKSKRPESQIILLTGHATVEKGVEAMKMGATDFLEKPADIEALERPKTGSRRSSNVSADNYRKKTFILKSYYLGHNGGARNGLARNWSN